MRFVFKRRLNVYPWRLALYFQLWHPDQKNSSQPLDISSTLKKRGSNITKPSKKTIWWVVHCDVHSGFLQLSRFRNLKRGSGCNRFFPSAKIWKKNRQKRKHPQQQHGVIERSHKIRSIWTGKRPADWQYIIYYNKDITLCADDKRVRI